MFPGCSLCLGKFAKKIRMVSSPSGEITRCIPVDVLGAFRLRVITILTQETTGHNGEMVKAHTAGA